MKKMLTTTLGTGLNILSHIAPEKTGELGFNLFCYPYRPKMLQKHRKFLQDAAWRTFTSQGQTIQTYRWGRGSKRILFAHGWQSHSYRWKAYIQNLDPEIYTIYALDAPAHGLSTGKALTIPHYAEIIRDMTNEAGSWHAMVGHSMGSFTLLYMAHVYPSVIPEKMILLAPPSGAAEFIRFYGDQLQLSDRTIRLTVDHFIDRMSNPPEYYSSSEFAKSLTIPGLIIHDVEDGDTPVENAREIARSWSNARLHVTEGLGHNLRSADIINEVTDFINQDV